MKKPWQNHRFAVILVTLYLVIYTILHQIGASAVLLGGMFALSPFLVVWMAYTILRHAPYNGGELAEGEEWGYQDKKKKENGEF
ncbi:MAG TPA: hypothetical protein VF145_11130 [Chitinophagaceae bacterium]